MSDGDDEPQDAADEEAAPETDDTTDEPEPTDTPEESADDGADESAEEEEPTADEAEEAEEAEGADEAEDAEDAAEETEDLPAPDLDADELNEQLDEVEAALEEAETEADLDDVESQLDDTEAALEAASLPEPEDEDEDDPREELESRVSDLRDGIEEARGPYGEDVVEAIETAISTIEDGEWTETGETEAADAVVAFTEAVEEPLGESVAVDGEFPDGHVAALESVAEAVDAADLDADEDAETIAALLEATDALESDLDDAEEWDDLTVVEQLQAQGFYDRLESKNRKDFPPELNVVRIAERENDPERILLAFEYLESDFMEENCLDAFRRMGAPEAYDAMMPLVNRRNQDAIQVIGKIGNDDACETLHGYIEDESNPPLQKVVLKALGEIGSEESTQPVADRLVAEDYEVRSQAARALGRIGDTRAIDPLADVLADDDSDNVRAAAAWALYQIGTEAALEAAAEYADDRSYIVENEAVKAADALDAAAPSA
ncbi:HEAT repeat domain-containing protein [Halorarius litoreus]|uniref:HEAT repeat domain-containing protein n=1 Tax=Halorarius litoreus TaxID=2962676 RepID=UPI0020CD3518|nr:HEAT repeat domain-containing protein [Halorarius litoreus]